MYKSKLQEFCQRRSWELPEYSTVKDGPDHMPRFTGTVTLRGQVFETPTHCKSSKEAQNTAARIAFECLNAPFSPPPPTSAHQSLGVSPAAPLRPVVPVAQLSPLLGVSTAAPPTAVDPVAQLSQFQGVTPAVAPAVRQPEVKPAALLPLSPLPSSLPIPNPGLLVKKNVNARPVNGELNGNDTAAQTYMVYRAAAAAAGSNDKHNKGALHMYKNQLQQFAQKNCLSLPVYTTETEGPPHARRFKSSVTVEEKLYETFEFSPTLKEAEQAAAKVACQMLLVNSTQEDGGLYKNLLQELAQTREMLCPTYETTRSGLPHRPLFVSTVEVGSHMVRGAEARTRKQAEMNAAKAAYCALMESAPAVEYTNATSPGACAGAGAGAGAGAVADNFSQNINHFPIMTKHQGSTSEEDVVQAKRAKSSPENTHVNTNHLPDHAPPPEGNPVYDVPTLHPQPAEERQPSHLSKTVVCPRNSSMPQPECASLLPYSDGQWVAYNVNQDQ